MQLFFGEFRIRRAHRNRAETEASMFGLILALAITSTCPLTIAIDNSGTLFSSRFSGWCETGTKALENELKGGCYNDANPIPFTSIKLLLTRDAPKPKLDRVLAILKEKGWSKDKIDIRVWDGKPPKPGRR
jgi:hypothetical protein